MQESTKSDKFAIIRSGNKQYKVKKGDIISVNRILVKNQPLKKGETIEFDALFISDKGKIKIGRPLISGKKIKAKVITNYKNKKVAVVKFKPKKRYLRQRGYRADKTKIEITTI